MSQRHAMSAKIWRHLAMSPTCRRHVELSVRRIDGVVVVLIVRQIDGVVVKNDKTDPDGPDDLDGNAAAAAVDCAAVGAVAELAPLNVSNPGK